MTTSQFLIFASLMIVGFVSLSFSDHVDRRFLVWTFDIIACIAYAMGLLYFYYQAVIA